MSDKSLDLFSQQASVYAATRPQYPQEWYEFLIKQCTGLDLAWEAGCGNGQATLALAHHFNRVIASDLSSEQIAHAPTISNVEFRVGAAEQIELPAGSCNLVCTAQALHWFDLNRYWSEVQRVLKRGGIFATWGYNWNTVDPTIDSCIQEVLLAGLEKYWASNNKLLWNGYRDIEFPFTKIEVPPISMPARYNLYELFGLYRSMSGVQLRIQQEGDAFFNDAFNVVKAQWGNPRLCKDTQWEFVTYCGRFQ